MAQFLFGAVEENEGGLFLIDTNDKVERISDVTVSGGPPAGRGDADIAVTGSRMIFKGLPSGLNDTGVEAWITDGTSEGTFILQDIYPGATSSLPGEFTESGGVVYFRANTEEHGSELYVTDGSSEGTYLLADLAAGSASSRPQSIVSFGEGIIFKATTSDTGTELFYSDGTSEGTDILIDLAPGNLSGLANFTELLSTSIFNSKLFFLADDGTTGLQLWTTDGSEAGTTRVTSGSVLGAQGYIFETAPFDDRLLFIVESGIWSTDGTPEGTIQIHGTASKLSQFNVST